MTAAVFEWPVRVYWEDTDAGGIVYYANYLRFFERARTEWLRACGVHQQALREQTGGQFVVSEASVRYHRPARLDDSLVVTAELVEGGRASLLIRQRALRRPPTGAAELLCEALVHAGWVDALTLRPTRIPPPVLEALRS